MTNVVRPASSVGHRRLNELLALGVEIARGFVENEDLRRRQDRPGDRQPLLLAAGELDAALADERLVFFGQPDDEFVRVGAAGGVFDLRVGRVVPAVGDVVAHRAVEQENVLLDDRQQIAITAQPKVANVDAIDAGCGLASDRETGRPGRSPSSCPRRCGRPARSTEPPGHDDVEVANDRPAFAIFELDVFNSDFLHDGRRVDAHRAGPACRSSIPSTSNTRSMAASERCSSENEFTMFHTGFSSRNVYH